MGFHVEDSASLLGDDNVCELPVAGGSTVQPKYKIPSHLLLTPSDLKPLEFAFGPLTVAASSLDGATAPSPRSLSLRSQHKTVFAKILLRSYFERIWVVQEIVSYHCIVICGNAPAVAWEALEWAAGLFMAEEINSHYSRIRNILLLAKIDEATRKRVRSWQPRPAEY
jgi:hypothetical protein